MRPWSISLSAAILSFCLREDLTRPPLHLRILQVTALSLLLQEALRESFSRVPSTPGVPLLDFKVPEDKVATSNLLLSFREIVTMFEFPGHSCDPYNPPECSGNDVLTSQGQVPDVLSLYVEKKSLCPHAWQGWDTQQVCARQEGQHSGTLSMVTPSTCKGSDLQAARAEE